jgi:hypothetical protein
MDRLARNLDDLRSLVQKLTKKAVRIEFLKENLIFTGEDSALANLMLSVMGAFAEFERALIGERQREGISLAKARGAYRGRRKALSSERASFGSGLAQANRRRVWPANSASAGKPSTSTSRKRVEGGRERQRAPALSRKLSLYAARETRLVEQHMKHPGYAASCVFEVV